MSTAALSNIEIQFYYTGLYKVLKRYRFATVLGWCMVAAGFAGFLVGWNVSGNAGLSTFLLPAITIAGGLTLVHQSVTFLESYTRISVPATEGEEREASAIRLEFQQLLRDIDNGGWQDAYAAIGRLKEMETRYGLPPLDR